jgi:PAS domain S-box-containing protein
VNKCFDSFIFPDTRPKFNDFLARAFKHQIKESIEVVLQRSTGDKLYVQLVAMISGNVNECLIATQDITKRKKTEESLQESEEHYRSLIEGIPGIVYSFSHKDGGTYYSSHMTELLGYTPEQLYAQPMLWHNSIHPEDISRVDQVIRESTRDKSFQLEYRIHDAQGNWHWFLDRSFGYHTDSFGDVIQGIAFDITKRKQTEEALQDQHSRLGSIIEGIRAGTWEWNVQTGETVFNERWAQILGYTLDELSPISIKTWVELTHPEDLKLSEELISQHLSGELPYYNSECRMKHKDGHWVWIHDSGKIITHTIDGRPLMMYGTHIDITERIFTEEALARAAERDHHIAEIFQQTAMPRHIPILPAHYEIGTEYQPALQEADVCGDFFDFFDLGDGDIGISIGDIAGKGLTAALRITAAKNMIRSYAFLYNNPAKVMSLVNDALCRDIAMESDMLTAFYAVLDTRNNTLTYSNAGHEPPLMRYSYGEVEPLKCGGSMFCGIGRQDYTEGRVFLQPGDLFVMVTDGITEAGTDRCNQYGAEGIMQYLSKNADTSADKITTAIFEDAKSFANGTLHDDATIIVIKRVSDQAVE